MSFERDCSSMRTDGLEYEGELSLPRSTSESESSSSSDTARSRLDGGRLTRHVRGDGVDAAAAADESAVCATASCPAWTAPPWLPPANATNKPTTRACNSRRIVVTEAIPSRGCYTRKERGAREWTFAPSRKLIVD
jgi:hypothetical protein